TNGSRATLAACHGDFSKAIRLLETNLQITKAMNDEGFTRTWHRFAIVVLAHYCWMAGDAAALEAHWPEMSAERTVFEWPMFDTCRALLRGRIALLAGRFDEAEAVLQEAVRLQALGRALTWTGDARCSLAICYQRRGREDLAREAFAPVFEEVLKEDCIGFLLMESAQHHEGLLSLLPAELRAQPRTQELIARLAAWRVTDDIDMSAQNSNNLSLVTLSTRELEVLACIAAGDSNKQIAKNLDLSSHTVKRHVANILAKLDCDTRGQAAARWRTAHGDDD
ncbi:MAG TPA: LuxR C-terminal-related transcriptional regulator, partial [Rhodocyclaceae bacterium]|nr:LuxR C-terminal-related transcriptional regulator [Rhodocyclaceae bacterium]